MISDDELRVELSAILGQIRHMELVFSVTQEADGGYVAECLSHDIFTQGDDWDALRTNVREAVDAFFFGQAKGISKIDILAKL